MKKNKRITFGKDGFYSGFCVCRDFDAMTFGNISFMILDLIVIWIW
jgi:hypothetical protein